MAEGDVSVVSASKKDFFLLPSLDPNQKYPLTVHYCGVCSMPIEYCEYYPMYDTCKAWLEKHLPDEFEKLQCIDIKDGEDDKKKRQTRGGKGMLKVKKKAEPQGVQLATAVRSKRKKVTIVTGLATYEIDLKKASKFFASKFSCGASVAGEDEIVIQGDVKDDLFDIISEHWPQIDEDDVEDLGEQKK